MNAFESKQNNPDLVEVEISTREPVLNSAQKYYEKYKEMKRKLIGLERAVQETEQKIKALENKKVEKKEAVAKKKLCWFERFHWGFTQNNLLVLAGRDSQSNEQLVKQHLETGDLLFHSTIQGSAQVVLKDGKTAGKEDLEDAALFAAIYSKGWSMGYSSVDVYFVYSEQVSKTPQTGEYLSQGAFVIRGEKNFFKKIQMIASVGIVDLENLFKEGEGKRVFVGREESLKKKGILVLAQLIPGRDKKGDIAKQILHKLDPESAKYITLDEVVQCLPPGTMEFVRKKKK